MRYAAPADCHPLLCLRSSSRLSPLAGKLVDLVPEMSLESSPVLVHALGDGGTAVYQHMAELMRADERGGSQGGGERAAVWRQLRGVVFDSGPGR